MMFEEIKLFNKILRAAFVVWVFLCIFFISSRVVAQKLPESTTSNQSVSETSTNNETPQETAKTAYTPSVPDYQKFLDSEIARKQSKNLEIVDLSRMDNQSKRNFFIAIMERGISPKFDSEADRKAFQAAKTDFNTIVEAADYAQQDSKRDGLYNIAPKNLAVNRIDEIMDNSSGSSLLGSIFGNDEDQKYLSVRDYVSWSKDFEQNLKFNFEANITDNIDFEADLLITKFGFKMDSNIDNKLQEMNDKLNNMVESGYITRDQAEQEAERIRQKLQKRVDEYVKNIRESNLDYDEKISRITEVTEDAEEAKDEIGDCAKSCLPKCYYKKLKDKCPFCSIFKVAFNVSSQMAYISINAFSGTFVKVVIIGFAIWIALQVLTFVSTISMVNFKNFIQPLLTQGFIVAFAVIVLQNGTMDFFNLALEPIYNTGMKLAQKTINIDEVAKAKQAKEKNINIEDIQTSCAEDYGIYSLTTPIKGALPPSMGNNILCIMNTIYNRAAKIKALGSASICQSWQDRAFIIPHIGYLLTGIGLWIGAMLMILGVPFMMIDSVLQLAVAAAMLPLAIAAYTFKITRKHTKAVWETFLNSMFSFIFVSLIALMLTLGFEHILIDSTKGSLDLLVSANANDDHLRAILKQIPWWGTSFLKVVFITILAWAMLREALDFASDFSSTMSKTSIGTNIATMGGSLAKGAVVKATSATAEAGFQVAKDAGGSVYRGARNLGRRGLMSVQARNIRNSAVNVQTDKRTGAKTYTDAKGNKVLYGSDGHMESVTRVKTSTNLITGRTTTAYKMKTRDVSITTMDVKNRNGNVIGHREIIRLNSSRFNNLQNANGTINNSIIDEVLAATPEEAQDKVKIAIAKEIMHQRHKNLGMSMRKHDYVDQEMLTDKSGRFIGFSETHSDGSKTVVNLKTGENGRMLSDLTRVDKKGRGLSLSTDGIINRRSKFKTEDGTVNGKIDAESVKTIYSVSSGYRGMNFNDPKFQKILEEECMFEDEQIKAAFASGDANDIDMYQFK